MVFVSHSHRDKSLVRAIRSYLPKHISAGIDEYELLIVQTHQHVDKKCDPGRGGFRDNFVLGREAMKSE